MGTRLTMMIIGIAMLIGLLLLSLPDVEDIPEEKMTSLSMAMCIADIKIDIRKRLDQGLAVITEYQNQCPQLIDRLKVSRSGNIEAFNEEKKIHLLFTPIKRNGTFQWTCTGTPAEFVPRACQNPNPQQAK